MRIRTIKPEFWMHEGLCKCSEFSRLLAVALLNWSDDEGYFMANPILIRGQVFPFEDDSKKVPRSLQELSSVGWIRIGNDDQGRSVGMVINFAKHQRVDKPKPSTIKASSVFQDASKNDLGRIQDASKEEGKGMEQGMEREQGTGNIPPNPQGGFDMNIQESPKPNPDRIAVGKLLGRRETTKWSAEEIKMIKAIQPIHPDDLTMMGEFYRAEIPKETDYRRTTIERLLKHWTGEMDKARAWKYSK
jgi:hypothetical protein